MLSPREGAANLGAGGSARDDVKKDVAASTNFVSRDILAIRYTASKGFRRLKRTFYRPESRGGIIRVEDCCSGVRVRWYDLVLDPDVSTTYSHWQRLRRNLVRPTHRRDQRPELSRMERLRRSDAVPGSPAP